MSGGMEEMHKRITGKSIAQRTLDRLEQAREENGEIREFLDISSMLSRAQESILQYVKDKQKNHAIHRVKL